MLKKEMNEIKKTVENKYGISVVKCCASCVFRNIKSGGRVCTKFGINVASNRYCKDWKMSPALDRVGSARGRVKTKEYLQYALNSYMGKLDLTVENKLDEAFEGKNTMDTREEYHNKGFKVFIDEK